MRFRALSFLAAALLLWGAHVLIRHRVHHAEQDAFVCGMFFGAKHSLRYIGDLARTPNAWPTNSRREIMIRVLRDPQVPQRYKVK